MCEKLVHMFVSEKKKKTVSRGCLGPQSSCKFANLFPVTHVGVSDLVHMSDLAWPWHDENHCRPLIPV